MGGSLETGRRLGSVVLLFVDDAGDPGFPAGNPTPSPFMCLSGLAMHRSVLPTVEGIVQTFRNDINLHYGIPLSVEVHAGEWIGGLQALSHVPKHVRLHLLGDLALRLAACPGLRLFNVAVDKINNPPGDLDPFEAAWGTLLRSFEGGFTKLTYTGCTNPEALGIVVSDRTDLVRLRELVERLQGKLPFAAHTCELFCVRGAPCFRDSTASALIQAADVCSFFLYQNQQPNKFVRNQGARNWLNRLAPLCPSPGNPALAEILRDR